MRAVDQSSGAVLLGQNVDQTFVTDSILKLYSTSTALDVLGPNYRFRTPVFRHGRGAYGVLTGYLFQVASGDFSFGLTRSAHRHARVQQCAADRSQLRRHRASRSCARAHSHPLAAVNELAHEVRADGIRRVQGNVVIDTRLFHTSHGWRVGLISPIWVNENAIDLITSLSPDFKQFFAADEDQGAIAAAFQEGY